MGLVKMERKISRLRAKASRRRTDLKNQAFMPVIKKVDIEELKASFKKKPAKKAAPKKTEAKEVVAETKEA